MTCAVLGKEGTIFPFIFSRKKITETLFQTFIIYKIVVSASNLLISVIVIG